MHGRNLSCLHLYHVLHVVLAFAESYLVESRETKDGVHQFRLTHRDECVLAVINVSERSLSLSICRLFEQLAASAVEHCCHGAVVGHLERCFYAALAYDVERSLCAAVIVHRHHAFYRTECAGLRHCGKTQLVADVHGFVEHGERRILHREVFLLAVLRHVEHADSHVAMVGVEVLHFFRSGCLIRESVSDACAYHRLHHSLAHVALSLVVGKCAERVELVHALRSCYDEVCLGRSQNR